MSLSLPDVQSFSEAPRLAFAVAAGGPVVGGIAEQLQMGAPGYVNYLLYWLRRTRRE